MNSIQVISVVALVFVGLGIYGTESKPGIFGQDPAKDLYGDGMAGAAEDLELFGELVLSSQDDAVLHSSLHLPGMFRGTTSDEPGKVKPVRVVSLASIVTLREVWQPTLTHYCDALDAMSSEEVTFTTGYDYGPTSGGQEFRISVSPVAGHTWGTISDIRDLHFTQAPVSSR